MHASLTTRGAAGLALLVAVLTAGGRSQDLGWSRFRGPNGSGLADSRGLPVTFGPGQNEIWKTPLPAGHSSPVLLRRHVLVTALEGEGRLTIAVHTMSGKGAWR